MNEIYRLQTVDRMGFHYDEKFFSNFDQAKEQFMQRIELAKKSEGYADDEDLEKPNGTVEENAEFHDGEILGCNIFSWHKVGYEEPEWDIDCERIQLHKIEVL